MGIKDLKKLLTRYAPQTIERIPATSLFSKKCAIDASIIACQVCAVAENPAMAFCGKIAKLDSLGAECSYVFDGVAPAAKAQTQLMRRQKPSAVKMLDISAYRELFKKILADKGKIIIDAPGEAEATCAEMYHKGLCDYILTEDTDILAMGGRMISGFNAAADMLTFIDGEKIPSALGISQQRFVELCVLLGCDYFDGLPKVGYVSAFKLASSHGFLDILKMKNAEERTEEFMTAFNLLDAPRLAKNQNISYAYNDDIGIDFNRGDVVVSGEAPEDDDAIDNEAGAHLADLDCIDARLKYSLVVDQSGYLVDADASETS